MSTRKYVKKKKKLRYKLFASELERLGLTQSELARVLGQDRQVIYQWCKYGTVFAHERFRNELLGLGFRLPPK